MYCMKNVLDSVVRVYKFCEDWFLPYMYLLRLVFDREPFGCTYRLGLWIIYMYIVTAHNLVPAMLIIGLVTIDAVIRKIKMALQVGVRNRLDQSLLSHWTMRIGRATISMPGPVCMVMANVRTWTTST